MYTYSPQVLKKKISGTLNLFYAIFFLFNLSGIAQTAPSGFNLVAYEGFNYNSGSSLLNANGGTGWTSPWTKSYQNRFLKTSTTGFTYTGLTTGGLKAQFDNTCYGTCNAIASLKRTFPLQSEGVVYFQFISVFEASASGGTPHIRLFDGTTWKGIIGANTGSFMSIVEVGGVQNSSSSNLNAQNLVVVRIDYNLNKTEMWINPNLSTFDYSNPTNPSASSLGFSPSFDRIDIFIRSGSIDEISVFSQPSPFITTWQTDVANNITIPLTGSGYDFKIDWGDGTVETKTGTPGNISHTYTTGGIKTVSITPNVITGFPRIYVNNFALRNNLLSIESWGSGQWGSDLTDSFAGAINLEVNATNAPDFSATTNFQSMFSGCTSITGINGFTNWNVSNVTNMSGMFSNAIIFNSDVSGWNVSNVTDMSGMFSNAINFNSDISGWNISNVTDMSYMFNNATNIDLNFGAWDISSLTDATNFLTNGKLSRKNYDNTLMGWQTLTIDETKIPEGLRVNFGFSNYSNNPWVISARTDLIVDKKWSITDGGIISVLTNNGELSGSHTININRNGALGSSAGVTNYGEIIN